MSLFEAESLSVSFGGIRAVDDVTFSVEEGEIFAIVGPNGAGKSTIFNLISRIYEPTGGRLTFQGQDITNVPPHTIARRGIAQHVVRGRLDAERVLARLEVLPFIQAGKLRFLYFDFETESQSVIGQEHRTTARSVGGQFVLPDLLVESGLRSRQRTIANTLPAVRGARMGSPGDVSDRRNKARAFVEQRIPDIHVVAEHVWRAIEAVIHDSIRESDFVSADIRLDAPDEVEIFAEYGALLDDALGP